MVAGGKIYIEGGGDAKDQHIACRAGFRKLLERSGFKGRMPHLVACGSRSKTFDDFRVAHEKTVNGYTAMLVDSEDLMEDIEKPWDHLLKRDEDKWKRPDAATDEQVFLMVTCMETWIVADRGALKGHYKQLIENRLPAIDHLEARDRQEVQNALRDATKECSNAYTKGKRSFELLEKLDPETLRKYLPSFSRMIRILAEKL